ncbi:MAG: 50S ribosomal protein L21 [archaeon]|nr:50S ribosomal protein L21 [archaeon]MCP8306891.1 50S ribosomal protein L21 [archaeon]
MVRSKGFRRKTRSLLTKKKKKGLTPFLHEYKVEDKVVINIDPSQVKGMPHRRYHGRVGTIREVRRRSVVVTVPMGGKVKKVIARLEHVKPHTEKVSV